MFQMNQQHVWVDEQMKQKKKKETTIVSTLKQYYCVCNLVILVI